ncbi:MAG TPA: caspase family protein [Povalibacter sp.]
MTLIPRFLARVTITLAPALLIVASAATPSDKAAATKGMVKRSDLEIVDCLLPGQVRQLGNSSYLTPRRPIRTTTSECSIRGGEYVAYDRADLKSALRIWMETAQAGDPEAMTNVGEIYERGMGVEPNYTEAAVWYQKAADKNYSRAIFNLGTLYEQGLGVPQDQLKALNLYRQASGIPEDSLIYTSAAQREQEALRKELESAISERDQQLGLLQKQLKDMQDKLAKQPVAQQTPDNSKEVEALKKWIAQLEGEKRKSAERLAGIPTTRSSQSRDLPQLPAVADERTLGGMKFGRYYAIVIGNQNYQTIESLQTPKHDVQRAARVLADKYGFNVQILEDADDVQMLKALNDLNSVLKPDDNLLIYYAGHGERLTRDGKTQSGYWLPVNADAPPKDTFWVPNEQITGHLSRLPAKRVLVVADSCYAGLLSTDPSYLFMSDKVSYSKDYVAYKLPKRARLLLTSGGDAPVLDEGSGGNSVFARAFIDELENNTGILSSPELFSRMSKRVEVAAAHNKFVQKPEFKSIKGAGHEVGDFFFVPRAKG